MDLSVVDSTGMRAVVIPAGLIERLREIEQEYGQASFLIQDRGTDHHTSLTTLAVTAQFDFVFNQNGPPKEGD